MYVIIGENVSYDESQIETYLVMNEEAAIAGVEKLKKFRDTKELLEFVSKQHTASLHLESKKSSYVRYCQFPHECNAEFEMENGCTVNMTSFNIHPIRLAEDMFRRGVQLINGLGIPLSPKEGYVAGDFKVYSIVCSSTQKMPNSAGLRMVEK